MAVAIASSIGHQNDENGIRLRVVSLTLDDGYTADGFPFTHADFGFAKIITAIFNSPPGYKLTWVTTTTGGLLYVEAVGDVGAGVYNFAEVADSEAGLDTLVVEGLVVGY